MLTGATTRSARADWVYDHPEIQDDNGRLVVVAAPASGSLPAVSPVNEDKKLAPSLPASASSDGKVRINAATVRLVPRTSASTSLEGKIRVVFRWVSGPPMPPGMPGGNQTPPEYVTFRIDAQVGASGNTDFQNVYPGNSFSKSSEASATGGTATTTVNGSTSSSSVTKTQYKTVAVENGEAKSPWIDVKVLGSIGADRVKVSTMYGPPGMPPMTSAVNGEVYAGVSLTFGKPYEKYVLLSRSGAPAPKKENDPTLNKDIDTWVEVDGTITVHGHSTYSYFFRDINGNNGNLIPNFQTFHANRIGNWSTNLSYQWQPSEAGGHTGQNGIVVSPLADTINTHEQEMPEGNPYKMPGGNWHGTTTSPSEKIITYMVTDNVDGLEARAQYRVTLHDEYEFESGPANPDINPFLGPENPIDVGYEPSNPGTTPKKLTYTIDTSQTTSFKNVATIESSLGISAEAGLSLPAIAAKGINLSTQVQGTTSIKNLHDSTNETEQSISLADSYTITLESNETAHPVYWVRCHLREFDLKKYGPLGFVGRGKATIKTYDDLPNDQKPVVFGWSQKGMIEDGGGGQP